MSQSQSVRLAQFWRFRLVPLLGASAQRDAVHAVDLFEAVLWLNEGVFCTFFDADDADLVWARIRNAVAAAQFPSGAVPEDKHERIRMLLRTSRPFREILQMTAGAQRRFELPLFASALLNGHRFASDSLAAAATAWLWSNLDIEPEQRPRVLAASPEDVAQELASDQVGQEPRGDRLSPAVVVAGHLRLIEHMHASDQFFEYARSLARRSNVDFDSYCERIGGVNAWRVPLFTAAGNSRFEDLTRATASVFARAIASGGNGDSAAFIGPFDAQARKLRDAWETHHLQGFFASP